MRFDVAIFGLVFVLAACPHLHSQNTTPTEKERIEALIEHVKGIDGAKFIRNGKEYDGGSAARFLRYKWDDLSAQVKTAADFIDKIASYSATSGQVYMIRFKDGMQVKSGDYLRGVLKKLDKKNP
jgi:N-methylhydantoinase B/oxoprolinase/acetone carboxylase alpha subunit